MPRKRIVSLVAIIATAAALALPTIASAGVPREGDETDMPMFQHIFVVMMENHSYDEIIGNPNAPRINALAQANGLATNYYGVTHPSEPNYLATIAGSFFGIQDDAPPSAPNHTINAPTIVDQLEARGLTWKTYQQSLPQPGFTGASFPSPSNALYAVKHNPFPFFAHVQNSPAELQNMVPDTQLATDLRSGMLPNFGYIAPDQCHDMHGLSSCRDDATLIQQGDAYAANVVSAITGADFWHKGNNAIIVTWDENDFNSSGVTGCCDANPGGGHVATIVVRNHHPRGMQDSTPFNHYSLLQTIQDAFRLDCLQNTCDRANVTPMTRLFRNGDD